jgi:hypothetical protein
MAKIRAPAAWGALFGTFTRYAHFRIAVLDSGVDYGHEDFQGMYRNFLQWPPRPNPQHVW